jgi:Flp pilus assembly pilin Flp
LGATSIEYAIIASLMVVTIAATVGLVGNKLVSMYDAIYAALLGP